MKLKTITAVIAALTSAGAYATSDFVDTAQVISSTPIIEHVADKRQECDNAPPPEKSTNYVAPIIGGLLGGLLGHQIGQGRGNTAATIVGAAGGAVAGNMVGNRRGAPPAQQCRTVESMREVVNGYNVVYRFHDRDVSVALPYDPGTGSTIKVGVGIILDERAADAAREPARGAYRDGQPGTERGAYRGAPPAPERRAYRDEPPMTAAERDTERYSDRGLQRDAEGSPAAAANSTSYNYRY